MNIPEVANGQGVNPSLSGAGSVNGLPLQEQKKEIKIGEVAEQTLSTKPEEIPCAAVNQNVLPDLNSFPLNMVITTVASTAGVIPPTGGSATNSETDMRKVMREQMRARRETLVETYLTRYLEESPILNLEAGVKKDKLRSALEIALRSWVKQNQNKWPGSESLKKAEQFFFNLYEKSKYGVVINDEVLIQEIFGGTIPGTFAEFKTFVGQYITRDPAGWFELSQENKFEIFKIYRALPQADRDAFFEEILLLNNAEKRQVRAAIKLAENQAFPPGEESIKREFFEFLEARNFIAEKDYEMTDCSPVKWLPIYQAFSDELVRGQFFEFCEKYMRSRMSNFSKRLKAERLLPIYQAFPDEVAREQFIEFRKKYSTDNLSTHQKMMTSAKVIPIYQAFQDELAREEFFQVCCSDDLRFAEKLEIDLNNLFAIYTREQMDEFKSFMALHDNLTRSNPEPLWECFLSFNSRGYLSAMRAAAALKAEEGEMKARRAQAFYETKKNSDSLPVYNGADRFLRLAMIANRTYVANAHDFDEIYEKERPILWERTPAPEQGTNSYMLYLSGDLTQEHITNVEVEDFIHYLDSEIANGPPIRFNQIELSGEEAVSLIKQMLGLEPKNGVTHGLFAPYLSSPMYYAKPELPRGDEMLGRVWHFMKNIHNEKSYETEDKRMRDVVDHKKSVVLAFLEAAEISAVGVDIHCQTRISGELFKAICWHLPTSKLRKLIAYEEVDTSSLVNEDRVKERIQEAPFRARQLFNTVKGGNGMAVRRVIEEQLQIDGGQPPLWKLYEAYYDELYGRTKNENSSGYKKDEHLLTRDKEGNLVSKYNADGSEREEPVVVYYQAEFQVLERVFSLLMHEEFAEQRGLIY